MSSRTVRAARATERQRLVVLASFASEFASSTFRLGGAPEDGSIHEELSAGALAFVEAITDAGWVTPFDWAAWAQTEEGQRLFRDPAQIATATAGQLGKVLTCLIRGERFSAGALSAAFESGLLLAIAERAEALLQEQ